MSRLSFHHVKKAYSSEPLLFSTLNKDPILQLRIWIEDAIKAGVIEPNAMTLATATKDGIPSSRMVLLKELEPTAFVFFSNYESRKGKELTENRYAALNFWWKELERQVSVLGSVEKISVEESQCYFNSRSKESRIAAWASKQSSKLTSRDELEKVVNQLRERFEGKEISLPPFWGGYRLLPTQIEFWQGRANRLHDRFCYTLLNEQWRAERLAP